MKTIQEELRGINTRNQVIKKLQNFAEDKGFLKVESDAFEEYSRYLEQNPRQNPKKLVKVQDLRGNLFFLKPDITTNLIKQVIPRIKSNEVVELYYVEKVYQYDSGGSIDASRQFGIELLGKSGIETDGELINYIKELLMSFDVRYKIELGSQAWVNLIIEQLNLDKQNKIALKKAIIAKNIAKIQTLISDKKYVGYVELIKATIRFQNNINLYRSVIENYGLNTKLNEVLKQLEILKEIVNDECIEIDLSLINEFDYYNGPIFKGYINDYKDSILRGGRYDFLTKDFGRLTPALGFSLDVDVLIMEVEQ